MGRLRIIRLVAGFDLLESLRSRKAIALLLLYLVASLGGSAIFIHVLGELRDSIGQELGLMGRMATLALLQSEELVQLIGKLVGDESLARSLLSIPVLALFYGWFSMTFIPLLVVLTSADAIAGELASGSVRYALFRVDRLSWALGKLVGQLCLMTLGVALGAIGCYLLGLILLDDFEPLASAWWIARLAGRSAVYGFAYLGVGLCASQLVRTRAMARGLGLLLLFFCWLVGHLLGSSYVTDLSPTVASGAQQLFPNAHSLDLWRPEVLDRGLAMAALLLIGLGFFALGFWRLARRDA
jgi:ABC-type transport system involved in multi-copper enzyme maturation permease subunit